MSTLSNPLRRLVGRHSLTTFFILTYLLSWWTVPFNDGELLPYGPSIAAVVVLAVGQGRPGLSRLWGQMRHWRVGWHWYAIAPSLILTYSLVALIISLLLGAKVDGGEFLSIGAFASVVIELMLLGGVWEEPGWSGYSLPALQTRFAGRQFGLLTASLVMAGFRCLWHAPLVIYGHIPWFDALFLSVSLQFVITWLYNRTEGSLPVVMLAHLSSNVIGGTIMIRLFTGSSQTLYRMVFVVVALVLALALNSRDRWGMGSRVEMPAGMAVAN